jgi:hypothetical protein
MWVTREILQYKRSLPPEAVPLMKAAMNAWVFGGMGSWNNMGFAGNAQVEYKAYRRGFSAS